MLSELIVNNFALIHELRLALGPGFNVITGETGAGKSIIVGAVMLILGGRASAELIRQGEEEAQVEAVFTPPTPGFFAPRLAALGLDEAEEIIVRRLISRQGRNRVYINGSPVTLAQLSQLSKGLIGISGQHEHQALLEPERQLTLVDEYGGLLSLRARLEEAVGRLGRLGAEVSRLDRDLAAARDKSELASFQAAEIAEAGIKPGEDEALERERRLIRNAETVYANIQAASEGLYSAEGAAVEVLGAVRGYLEKALRYDETLEGVLAQVNEAYFQAEDAASRLTSRLEELSFDPARLEELEDRLALINRFKRKYGPTLTDVLAFARRADDSLEDLAGMEKRLEALEKERAALAAQTLTLAEELSLRRQEAAGLLSKGVAGELIHLGMPAARFEARLTRPQDRNQVPATGWEEAEFMIAPNLGEELMPLAKIASGGELSRTLLGVKTLLAGKDNIQTLIFDEVDAGIGGAVAEAVGLKIKHLAGFHQVVCITHLPQIATLASCHLHVFKEVRGGRTITDIRLLDGEERVVEVARMLGGSKTTEKALAAAREMIGGHGG